MFRCTDGCSAESVGGRRQTADSGLERGRGDLALERIERSWTTWRGRAVEPLIRESLLVEEADRLTVSTASAPGDDAAAGPELDCGDGHGDPE
ncbi:DUF234 domain-containing protein [Streptomyces marianii]|uniref:DUF234 domain-containing protein n=1 Tax=Streptomyces marianii TaxID=1817406 RepID=A0A5R9E1I2_9ACTN|nr:DUF234 domain-containing protein [Streptomyces marianii]TLQ43740.1 DUF234 domain-containing protein [Streptomyces marianii]